MTSCFVDESEINQINQIACSHWNFKLYYNFNLEIFLKHKLKEDKIPYQKLPFFFSLRQCGDSNIVGVFSPPLCVSFFPLPLYCTRFNLVLLGYFQRNINHFNLVMNYIVLSEKMTQTSLIPIKPIVLVNCKVKKSVFNVYKKFVSFSASSEEAENKDYVHSELLCISVYFITCLWLKGHRYFFVSMHVYTMTSCLIIMLYAVTSIKWVEFINVILFEENFSGTYQYKNQYWYPFISIVLKIWDVIIKKIFNRYTTVEKYV